MPGATSSRDTCWPASPRWCWAVWCWAEVKRDNGLLALESDLFAVPDQANTVGSDLEDARCADRSTFLNTLVVDDRDTTVRGEEDGHKVERRLRVGGSVDDEGTDASRRLGGIRQRVARRHVRSRHEGRGEHQPGDSDSGSSLSSIRHRSTPRHY